jgi:hypothetical protein
MTGNKSYITKLYYQACKLNSVTMFCDWLKLSGQIWVILNKNVAISDVREVAIRIQVNQGLGNSVTGLGTAHP